MCLQIGSLTLKKGEETMKRLGKVFLGVLCIILLLVASNASEIQWVTSNKVTFKWDATTTYTDGKPIRKKDGKILYLIYVYHHNKRKKELTEKYVSMVRFDEKTPIAETRCEISFKDKGRYFLGVQALLYKVNKNGKISDRPFKTSAISWSSKDTCTNNHPSGVEDVKKIVCRKK
jgi:hypothetical protein